MLIIDEEATQGLDDTTLRAEAKYSIYPKKPNKRFVLILRYIN